MASRTLPNVGLKGFWSLGEDNWKEENDTNLLKLSVLTQGRVLSLVSATPGSPSAGDVHLFSDSHPTQAGKVAVYDNSAWVYITPLTGWQLYDVASGFSRRYNGTTWAQIVEGGGGGVTFSGALVKKTATQSLSASTNALVTWDAEEYDDGGWHSTTTDTSRMTVPSGVTRVRLAARISRDNITDQLVVNILKNGADAIGMPWSDTENSGTDSVSVASAVVAVTAGDYFEVQAYTNNASVVQTTSWFSIEKVS